MNSLLTDEQWEFAMYGLRNLSVGDEEETRIADDMSEVPEAVKQEVLDLAAKGEYEQAYKLAVWELLKLQPKELILAKIQTWDWDWAAIEEGEEDEAAVTKSDMVAVYEELRKEQ